MLAAMSSTIAAPTVTTVASDVEASHEITQDRLQASLDEDASLYTPGHFKITNVRLIKAKSGRER